MRGCCRPSRSAIARMLAPSNPRSANSAMAASRIPPRVSSERCCSALLRGRPRRSTVDFSFALFAMFNWLTRLQEKRQEGPCTIDYCDHLGLQILFHRHSAVQPSLSGNGVVHQNSEALILLLPATKLGEVDPSERSSLASPKLYSTVFVASFNSGQTTSEGLTPKTASLSRNSSPSKNRWVTRVR